MTYVSGLDKLKAAIQARANATANKVQRGLKKAGLFVQRESQLIVPIDTSALKNSARTLQEGEGFGTVVRVVYGTVYAVYVHEDLQAQHAPGKQAKFLEHVIRTKLRQIEKIVIDEVQK